MGGSSREHSRGTAARVARVPRISFTSSLQRHVACPAEPVDGGTVSAALEEYFSRHPGARSYVLDEQGTLRKHVVVFVDGEQIRDRTRLGDPVSEAGEIFVMQALSGG
jgi:sulfur-carrier protein